MCSEVGTITFIEDGNAGGDDDPSALLAQPADTAVGESEGAGTVDKDGMKYLNGSTYKVTALVKSPEYVARASATYGLSTSPTGSIDLLAWVPEGRSTLRLSKTDIRWSTWFATA